MKLTLLLILATLTFAAEPDWKAVDQHAVDFLQRYVRIESVNPPADTRATSALIKSELEAAGFTVKLYSSGPNGQTNVVTRLAGRDRSKKPLLLLNHQDVVPVDRKAWSVDPFGALIKDGWIWGRGTLDMKGIGTMQIAALIALKQSGFVPARDIVMFSSADEETDGIYGIRWMLANHLDEIDAEYVIDEGGAVSRDLLSNGKLIFGVAVGEKQMLWLKLRAKGTAAHGSQPIADNANMILLEAIPKAMAMQPAK
ncbi:MAG: M20/M25/M40 family metallo-hydrolase, partial [Bryobacteraceae bacterium]